MGSQDPRIDAYIAASAEFAGPVLEHLRSLVHQAVPEVEETIKWGMPFFLHHGMLCHMASFKGHCAFHIHKGEDLAVGRKQEGAEGMGQFGKIRTLGDLPADATLLGFIREAAQRNASLPKTTGGGAKAKPKPATVAVPDDLAAALTANTAAAGHWDTLTAAQRRDYITWLDEAKQAPTRQKRLQTTLEWVAEGKTRNWKYEKKR